MLKLTPAVKLMVIFNMVRCLQSELFSSIVHLQTSLYAEKRIASVIKSYIQYEENRLNDLRRIAEDMEDHSAMALQDTTLHLTNPVDVYLFVKKFTLDWDKNVHRLIFDDNKRNELRQLVRTALLDLPNYEDLHGVTDALSRLQETYQLTVTDIADGDLKGIKSTKLTVNDCFHIGQVSYKDQNFVHSSSWLSYTLEKLKAEADEENIAFNTVQLLDILAFSEYMTGNIKAALSYTKELLSLAPDYRRAALDKMYYEKMVTDLTGNNNRNCGTNGTSEEHVLSITSIDPIHQQPEGMRNYQALCRGERVMDIKDKHKLICRYRTRNNPLLILSPAKEEELHLDPWIVVYHDIISDTEIETVKQQSTHLLNRASVFMKDNPDGEVVDYRVSKSAWLSEDVHPVFASLNARIGRISGLTMKTAENLQVGNYGIGGHYAPHFDHALTEAESNFETEVGNRIATLMFYMSDVTAGGATVFPYIGLSVYPIKGAAVFWYNLKRSGEGIFDTWHAGCPVLVGTKWVANKWIHERGQEVTRPCGLSPEE